MRAKRASAISRSPTSHRDGGRPRERSRWPTGVWGASEARSARSARALDGPHRRDGEGGIRTLGTLWVHTLSRRAPSATRAPLQRDNRRKCAPGTQADAPRATADCASDAGTAMATIPPRDRTPGSRRRRGRHRRRRPEDTSRPAPLVPEVSTLAAGQAPHETLSPSEVAEMKEHLAFLRRYKEILRLKLNAAEDLLVNGQREPSERGVCRHLIGKVDRAVIDAAIGRE